MTANNQSQQYLTERQAAEYLGFRPATLRQSRWSGKLAGAPAPRHIALGRNIRYHQSDLSEWAQRLAGGVFA